MDLNSFQTKLSLLLILLLSSFSLTCCQNTCSPSSLNDKIFVGSSTLTPGILRPGINSFSMANGVIDSLVPTPSIYNSSKLQIAQSFRNFASSMPNGGYEMNDFSFHSVFLSSTQIRFLFLWNEASSINVTISLSIQFLLTYDREEFLMGSFVIDPVQFLLKQLNQNTVNYSRAMRFKDLNPLTTIPNQSSSLSVNLFIVGLRYFGQGVSIRLRSENYKTDSSELTFAIQRSNASLKGLSFVHVSYVLFDRIILAPEFRMFFSWDQLGNQDKIDYWIKGVQEINFKQFQTGDLAFSEIYFYKINRLQCSQGCAGCVSIQNCRRIQGIVINDTECIACTAGSRFNAQTLKCELSTTCRSTQIWNGSQCICRNGLVRVNSQCIQCPQNTTYNSSSQLCDLQCDQNSTLTTSNQCICKKGYNIIDGRCSLCPANTTYDSISRRCLLICSAVEFYNQTSQRCECISGLFRINGTCGRCTSGFTYDSSTQTCIFNCGVNQGLINGTCRCLDGFVIISGACSKCPSGTIYNSLLQNCVPSCTGNRRILNGKCVCNQGAYQIGNQCGTCPQGTNYNNFSKSCDSALSCRLNQVLVNGVCTCSGPYVNGNCQPCSTNLIWNASLQQCILRCPVNSLYNSTFKACVCNAGFFVIGQTCSVCPSSTVYDFGTRSCQNGQICSGANEVFFLGLCICNVGFFRIQGRCSTCPSGTIYNETIFDCQRVCGLNQIYNSSTLRCECNSLLGFFRINNTCQQCPSGTNFNSSSSTCSSNCPSGQVFINGKCSCPTGFNLIGTMCGLCDIGTVYNASALKCDKACPDANGYFQNGRCFCYPPYIVVNQNGCQLCPVNTTYDLSTLSCRSSTPSNNSNLTCNTTSQIRKMNSSTGQYYCECDEAQRYYLIYDRCGTCQMFTKYNPSTKSCELDISLLASNRVIYFDGQNSMRVGGSINASDCQIKDHKVLTSGVCRCITTAIRFGTQCIVCPANSSPNSQQTACQCNSGFQLLINDYTCRSNSNSSVQNSSSQCPTNQIWNRNSCSCIEEFYRINDTCQRCPTFSAFNGSTCVCQFGYFPQSLNSLNIPSICQKCHSSCSSCTGKSESQCLSCVNISSILRNGQCISQNCSIGFYLVVYSTNVSKCEKCSAYCKSCVSNIQCTLCVDGFGIYDHRLTPTLSVKVCSQICGDGKRFERNCDDGNTESGDGCNKDCEVETGWTCVGGSTTSNDVCSLTTPAPRAIIVVMNATIQRGLINQNIRMTYIPDFFLKTDCSLCSNLFKITVTEARIIPDSIRVSYIPKSRYQFNIEFKFSDILTIPIFKFGVQLNPQYKQYFTEWDMAQWYDLEVNSVLLSRKRAEFYLREDQIQ